MLHELRSRQRAGQPIHVGLIGLGSMGRAVAHQVRLTPGMRLAFMADVDESAVAAAARIYGEPVHVTTDATRVLEEHTVPVDVLVEATNTILPAFRYCQAAIERGAHCVLMNAEVDLVLGHLLRHMAAKAGVVVTSDAGDQHGVLARLMEEIQLWGFEIVQAGNMKGFLDRYRTLAGSVEIAKTLDLSTVQCLAYTDGSKLNIEMAIVANEFGLVPTVPGMEGPRAGRVEEVLDLFDFDAYGGQGRVDYILGAQAHGGGVYVVGRCDSELQHKYLNYYKVSHRHPYYLFLRPYHLCHLETPRAIALAVLRGRALCNMRQGRLADVYAHAKRNLVPGDPIGHAIGSDEVYGMIHDCRSAKRGGLVPQGLLEAEGSACSPRLARAVAKDAALTWDDIELPSTEVLGLWAQQESCLTAPRHREDVALKG